MNRAAMNRIKFFVLCLLAQTPTLAFAQTQQRPISSQEYIQSVSPIAGGGTISSRSVPGQNVQTVTTIAQLPSASNSNSAVGYQPRQYQGQWGGQSIPATGTTASNGYVYPSGNPNLIAGRPTNTLGYQPIGSRAFQQTRLFQPPSNQLAQNCPTCAGGTSTNYPVQNFSPVSPIQPPQFQNGVANTPPAILAPPNLTAPQPVFAPDNNWQSGMQYDPNFGTSPGAFNSGRTNYTPLFALRNLPPGTYLGQGLLGQPKAYIDGEPIRNLLRYMTY